MHTIYRFLLRLLPERMRATFADEMEQVLRDRITDSRQVRFFWLREIGGLLGAALTVPREGWFSGWGGDIRAAVRAHTRHPKFPLLAIAMLAVGIGGCTALFSMLNAWVLNPLPFDGPDRLLFVTTFDTVRGWEDGISPADLEDMRRDPAFEAMTAWSNQNYNVGGGGAAEPQRVKGVRVNSNFFRVLGVEPVLGRTFLPEEDQPGAARSVILSHEFWETHFLGDRALIGRTILLDDEPVTVAGVLPPQFQFTLVGRAHVYTPLALTIAQRNNRTSHWLSVMARSKPGVSLVRAREALSAVAKSLEERYPASNSKVGMRAILLADEIGKHQGNQVVWVCFGLTIFVLLIVCSNIANLVLAKSVERQKEMAVRFAMGASRYRVIRQMLVEHVVLFVAGAAGSALVALYITRWITAAIPYEVRQYLRDYAYFPVDLKALLFSLAIALLTGILFGLAPAIEGSRADLNNALKEGSGRGSTGRRGRWIRNTLVGGEIALATALLVAGALLVQSMKHIWRSDPGFNTAGLVSVELSLSRKGYTELPKATRAIESMVERIGALAGVTSTSAAQYVPFTGSYGGTNFWIEGRPDPPPGEIPVTRYNPVLPGYFKTMQIGLIAGRELSDHDDANAPRVAIVNDVFVKRHWPGESAIGKRIRLDKRDSDPVEIVGVVKAVKTFFGANDTPSRQIYVPLRQAASRRANVIVRVAGDPSGLTAAIRSEIHAVDSNVPVPAIRPLATVIEESVTPFVVTTQMVGAFSVLALVLAATGLYAVMSWSVTQRTRELGIRMALGAASGDVARMVLRRAAVLVAVGLVLGLGAALAITGLLTVVLYEVSPRDPLVFGGVALTLALVAFAASYLPARRAARLDPVTALRHE
jgi:putative ABC transport system permease protein